MIRSDWLRRRAAVAPLPLSEEPAFVMGQLLLETLEQRRSQLIGRATVLTAADSALILAVFQFVLGQSATTPWISVVIGITSLLLSAMALILGLRLIGGVTRRTRKSPKFRRDQLLFFGTVTKLDQASLSLRLKAMTAEGAVDELSAQAISLTQVLRNRYDALKRSFSMTLWAVVLLILAYLASYYEVVNETIAPLFEVLVKGGIK
ncbi:Pycsar system effector family protein [Rathayibacter sp. PhB152]|uniref:Pycsar system effector family protein n=1 Tax=Rathayibacter sp. PhB152 TaxID=2485190 RepID=UPI0011CDEEB6|nr:Pycsar system effector family protein [Rathayibacter sp. PhB152]